MASLRSQPAQGRPTGDLAGFPTIAVPSRLYRAHVHGPWWFSSFAASSTAAPMGRFDLAQPRGSCYLAQGPVGAARERLGAYPGRALHADEATRAAVVSALAVSDWNSVADFEHAGAPLFGVTRELSVLPDYVLGSAWATAVDSVAAGIRYTLRFGIPDAGYALFGAAGEHYSRATDPHPRRFVDVLADAGYEILQTPTHLNAREPEG